MARTVLVTGASSGFGALTTRRLADAGHAVYASMRELADDAVAAVRSYASAHGVDLRALALDVRDQGSVDSAVAQVIAERDRIDVLVHNAGHMAFGPAEAFTPEQFAALYDINVVGAQRLNRAALPHMRTAGGDRLVVWVSSTSTRGGTPPYIAPYFAAKAAMDSLAVSYAGELARWGIETVIASPGVFTSGTKHFAHADRPADEACAAAYADGPTRDLGEQAQHADLRATPADAEPHLDGLELAAPAAHARPRRSFAREGRSYPGASSIGSDARQGLQSHPTVKPTAMLYDALLDVTQRGEVVLDPFLGSGSTLLAADKAGRVWMQPFGFGQADALSLDHLREDGSGA